MDSPPSARNKLLRSLTSESLCSIADRLEPVSLRPGRILHYPRLPIRSVYFLEEGLVSVDVPTERANHPVQAWLIGPEGLAGVPVVLGAVSSPHRRTVQVGGSAWAISAAELRRATDEVPELRRVLLCYVHSVLVQVAQISACNARHPVIGRVACWLLMAQDRLASPGLRLTHDCLASMLGVRRASVGEALHHLARAGAIRVERGLIVVADRPSLEDSTCFCYSVLKAGFHRELAASTPPSA